MGIFTVLKEFVKSSREVDPYPKELIEADVENATKAWSKEEEEANRKASIEIEARFQATNIMLELTNEGVPPKLLAIRDGEDGTQYLTRLTGIKKRWDTHQMNMGRRVPTYSAGAPGMTTFSSAKPAYTLGDPNPVSFHTGLQNKSSGTLRGQRSQHMYFADEEEVESSMTRVSLEEYVQMLQSIPIVHKVSILFDDRPNEVSIRVEYLENMLNLNRDILQDANEELTKVTSYVRITNCERIEITYIQKEVIT